MRKILITVISIVILILLSLATILATTGYETNRFNNFIIDQIEKNNNKVSLKLEKIKFKLDIKNLSLYLQTFDPLISYKALKIPIKNIKIYLDLFSISNLKPQVRKMNFASEELDIKDIKAIILKTKPSSLNSLIVNKVNKGKALSELEIYFDNNQEINNFIIKGEVKKTEIDIGNNLLLKDTNFTFFADATDILIKKINSKSTGLSIKDGNLQIKKDKSIQIKSDFKTIVKINEKNISYYSKFLKDINFINENINIKADLDHFLDITFDKTFKVLEYSYKNRGKINKSSVELKSPINLKTLKNKIDLIFFENSEIKTLVSPSQNTLEAKGTYSFDNSSFHKFGIVSKKDGKLFNIDLNFSFKNFLKIDLINYIKDEKKISDIKLNFEIKKDFLHIKNFLYKEDKNIIALDNLKIIKSNITDLNNIEVKTYSGNNLKNDFKLFFGKQIKILGKKYDAKNLNKFINQKSKDNPFNKISKNIEIDLQNIDTPLSKRLSNFKLIGIIEKGKFVKISSKGEFGNNKFLDITMQSDKKNKKKFLEIYSDLPQPLLTEYSFFKGLSDGILTFSSIIEEKSSVSKLVIDDFKLVNAPGVVRLLSLADFGGLADLAEGDGLSFEKMEINILNNEGFLKLDELYAVGPSISVLMDGYRDTNELTSLRGTLVPAKNLNKLLSKIPVIGKIIIPKEIGEGLFGVSFKIKGKPGKLKTTINPIKTLTPRFITRALEKSK